jgi:EAL and modified HD-GYP domain-containing signal transduction protein
MSEDFIVRNPLLDPKQHVLGYQLSWKSRSGDAKKTEALLHFVSEQFNNEQGALASGLLFLDIAPSSLKGELIQAFVPQNTVFGLKMAELAEPDVQADVSFLSKQGFGIMMRDAEAVAQDKSLLALASHLEIRFHGTDVSTQAKIYGALKQSPVRMVASEIREWKEFDACASLGLSAFIGNLYLQPRQESKNKGINPTQALILQLMDMVRKNADVREIESALKRDVALSYRLLRYINSSGFGLGTEIQSLRHAVSLLGYSPLYRWLSVLLASATDNAQAEVLMQAAIIRGRFAETLAQQGMLPKSEAENLFVAGMFSLLDRLLGIPMDQVLESVQLPDSIMEALISRSGMYGPFLALAEACESAENDIDRLADALFIGARQVNQAHLSALKWALNLKL